MPGEYPKKKWFILLFWFQISRSNQGKFIWRHMLINFQLFISILPGRSYFNYFQTKNIAIDFIIALLTTCGSFISNFSMKISYISHADRMNDDTGTYEFSVLEFQEFVWISFETLNNKCTQTCTRIHVICMERVLKNNKIV